MVEGEINSVLESYNKKNISVATIGSHSALNIFMGAKEEGLSTVCVCQKGREKIYKHYGLVDDFIMVEDLHDILRPEIQERLKKLNSIVIPHGSFNAYIDQDQMTDEFKVPVFGNRTLMQYEVSREKQHKWLRDAGLKVPYIYKSIEDITGLAFVKFPGAKGGKGYFVVDSPDAFEEKIQYMVDRGLLTPEEAQHPYLQEYIIGVSIYPHFFYSPLKGELEFMGFDKRYESSVDGVFRIPVHEQIKQRLNPSFSVVGNFPLVARESLLGPMFEMGEQIVKQSRKIAAPGTIGPFCLETIVTEDLDIVAFEISARIVAGCNANIGGDPYTYLKYREPMYMGKRIAREIKTAAQTDALKSIIT